jgi:glycosyltransferase involved in cell wall biosynthesis
VRRRLHLSRLRLSASCESRIICVSDAIRNSLVRNYGFPASKTITIHNGVSSSEFEKDEKRGLALRTRLGLSNDEFVLVSTSRLSDGKGLDILLSALAQVIHQGVRVKCIIVGDGPLRVELEQQSLRLGLADNVFFEGFQEDVRPYLYAGTAFVLTSHREGLGISILEAMAAGLPSLVTDSGGPAEVITHGVHGLVVAPGSVSEVAAGITFMVARPQECAQMGRSARTRVCKEFDKEKRITDIHHLILT